MTKQKEEAKQIDVEFFGGCPVCGGNDGYLNIHREHWFSCSKHRFRWCWGSNLISTWRLENENDWKKNWERIGAYAECKPWFPTNKME